MQTLAEITFPPTILPPSIGYEMLVYVPYTWRWTGGNLSPGDIATATLFYPGAGSEVLSNNIDLDTLTWEWKMHALLPDDYPVEIRRNTDGCLIGERKYIAIGLHDE